MAGADAAPPLWWQNLTVTEPVPPKAGDFETPRYVYRNHDLFSNFRDTTFSTDSSQYDRGIIVIGAVFALLGAALFLAVPIIYVSVARCDCCCRRLKQPGRRVGPIFKWLLIAASILMVVGALLSIGGFILSDQALVQTTQNLGTIGASLETAGNTINSTLDTASDMVEAFGSFLTAADVCNVPDSTVAGYNITEYLNATSRAEVLATLEDATAVINAVQADENLIGLSNQVYNVQDTLASSKRARRAVIVIVFTLNVIVVSTFLVFSVLMLRPSTRLTSLPKLSTWTTCLVSPLAVLLIAGAWIVVGVSFMMSALTGDYCVDPNASTLELVGNSSIAESYVYCGKEQLTIGIPALLYEVRTEMAKGIELLGDALYGAASNTSCMYESGAYSDFSDALYGVWITLDTVEVLAVCNVVNGIYINTVYGTVCTTLSLGLRWLLIGCMTLGAALTVAMISYRILVERRMREQRADATGPGLRLQEENPIILAVEGDGADSEARGETPLVDKRKSLRDRGAQSEAKQDVISPLG